MAPAPDHAELCCGRDTGKGKRHLRLRLSAIDRLSLKRGRTRFTTFKGYTRVADVPRQAILARATLENNKAPAFIAYVILVTNRLIGHHAIHLVGGVCVQRNYRILGLKISCVSETRREALPAHEYRGLKVSRSVGKDYGFVVVACKHELRGLLNGTYNVPLPYAAGPSDGYDGGRGGGGGGV